MCGDILLKKKGKDNDRYRLAFVIVYGIFYVFLLCTTTSPIAFTYILPIISLIVIFKDEKFMIYCAVANMLSLIASIAFHILVLGQNTAVDHKNYQLQIACLLLCYIGYIMSVRHLTESDAALTESIKSDLNRVVTTVEQVKTASNTIMDGITVVRELASENKHGSDVVVDGMNKLTGNNKQLQSHTASSQEMTTDISSQVENVAAMINDMVSLTTESGKHAKVSSEDLEGLAQTAKTMSELSTEVESILTTFRDEFEMVKNETGMYRTISENYDKQKKREHEYKNQLALIAALASENRADEINHYLKQYNHEIMQHTDFIDTNNVIVNAILNSRYQETREKGIVFVVKVNDLSALRIKDEDIVLILSNLLNNAIEASEQCENPIIKMKFVKEEHQIVLSVTNTFSGKPVIVGKRYITTKNEEADRHGIGLENIKETVEKYDGSCVIKHDKNNFKVAILIHNQEE